jgi:hypothetical protein
VCDKGERIEAVGLDGADEPTHALLPARTQGRHDPFMLWGSGGPSSTRAGADRYATGRR